MLHGRRRATSSRSLTTLVLVVLSCASFPMACGAQGGAGGAQRDHHGNLLTSTGDYVHTNALIFESSPYLLQHAHNPVQWMAWGEEAFAKARAENKPIFMSIGYSTCHWCHVMARESFSDERVAGILNDFFVCIKVDREERPDVDDVYMTAVQLLRGRGGWPLSAWLTPELEPFEAGTYYRKNQFIQLLERLNGRWLGEQVVVRQEARSLAARVRRTMGATRRAGEVSDLALVQAVSSLGRGYDEVHGGWGVPKFPRESTLLYMFDRWQRDGDATAMHMVLGSLDGMQSGGIHDQVGGGFARYSVDAQWLVPHFEKMLYNQAWLGRAYLEGYRLTGNERYRRTAEGIFRYVRRDMTTPGGAFYSAEDADSIQAAF